MKVVSVINYKGGVGKTTVTSNIAAQLAWTGRKVLMIDLDPQTNLTFSFIRPGDWEKTFAEKKTIKTLFDSLLQGKEGSVSDLIHQPKRAREALKGNGQLDLVCSHLGLINVDLELATLLGGGSMRQIKQNFLKVHSRLAQAIDRIDDDKYDVVIVDCPPNFNIVTKTAIVASDYILVPTRPDYLSTLGIDYLIRNVEGLVKDYNEYALEGDEKAPEIQPATIGVMFNMIQITRGAPISSQATYIEQIKRQSGLNVFPTAIRRNDTLFAGAAETGVPVVLTHQTGSTYKGIVDELEKVTEEFATSIGV
jgi:chromosome partitioning protein